MTNIVLTFTGFVLMKGIFMMIFGRGHRQIGSTPHMHTNNGLHTNLHKTDGKEISEASAAA
jgi:hypothetical protein